MSQLSKGVDQLAPGGARKTQLVSSGHSRGQFCGALTAGLFMLAGCAAMQPRFSTRHVAQAATVRAAPEVLRESLFARHPAGKLSEAALQRILGAPMQFVLPARVGVLPVVRAFDWRGPGPNYGRPPAAARALAHALRQTQTFSFVTEMMPIPSGALGMEALREVAARYQLRYLLLYTETVDTEARLTPYAAAYATLIGALFIRGHRLHARGYLEATLFDAKTGVLLFTTRRGVEADRAASPFGHARKLRTLARGTAMAGAPELAKDVLTLATRLHAETEDQAFATDDAPAVRLGVLRTQ